MRSGLVSISMLSEEDGLRDGRERSILVSLLCGLGFGERRVCWDEDVDIAKVSKGCSTSCFLFREVASSPLKSRHVE